MFSLENITICDLEETEEILSNYGVCMLGNNLILNILYFRIFPLDTICYFE